MQHGVRNLHICLCPLSTRARSPCHHPAPLHCTVGVVLPLVVASARAIVIMWLQRHVDTLFLSWEIIEGPCWPTNIPGCYYINYCFYSLSDSKAFILFASCLVKAFQTRTRFRLRPSCDHIVLLLFVGIAGCILQPSATLDLWSIQGCITVIVCTQTVA